MGRVVPGDSRLHITSWSASAAADGKQALPSGGIADTQMKGIALAPGRGYDEVVVLAGGDAVAQTSRLQGKPRIMQGELRFGRGTSRTVARLNSEDREVETIDFGVDTEGLELASREPEGERRSAFRNGLGEGFTYCRDIAEADVDG